MREIRWTVFHRPGPAWQAGVPMFEQDGLQAHVEHYRAWLTLGKLALGGPYLDDAGGGMMVAMPAVTEDELRAHAAADPAVASGLLHFEVRPWMVAMQAAPSGGTPTTG